MASTEATIEPFESGQVRFIDDQKVISYGTSSYGYDVRCASEFKIFTNVHTTNVVDPKNFDETKSRVISCFCPCLICYPDHNCNKLNNSQRFGLS